jgi:hypothetical protein
MFLPIFFLFNSLLTMFLLFTRLLTTNTTWGRHEHDRSMQANRYEWRGWPLTMAGAQTTARAQTMVGSRTMAGASMHKGGTWMNEVGTGTDEWGQGGTGEIPSSVPTPSLVFFFLHFIYSLRTQN